MSVLTGLVIAGQGIGNFLQQLDSWGFFRYGLPFLLIFAIVYGILIKTAIFGDETKAKGVNAVIAIAVGLLALQWGVVPDFFASIFPNLGVGLSILLVALLLLGLFTEFTGTDQHWTKITFFVIGAIIAVWVVIDSLTASGAWIGGSWWETYGPAIITLAALAGLVGWAMSGGGRGAARHP